MDLVRRGHHLVSGLDGFQVHLGALRRDESVLIC
jgi:hypothetical protein